MKEIEIKLNLKIEEHTKKTALSNYYHYTTVDAFYNIIKTKELWLGDTSTMNDKSELTNFTKSLQENLLLELPEKKKDIDDYFNKVNERVANEYPFALCFTTLKDDAAQWERYADNAKGIRIGFDTNTLLLLCKKLIFSFNEVFYKWNSKEHKHYEILKTYFKTGELEEFDNINGQIDNLICVSALHKHNSFRSEKEYRMVTLLNNIGNTEYSKIEFECRNNVIKKYLKLNIDKISSNKDINLQMLIKNVLIGPLSSQNENILRKFCCENGFNDIKISRSDCPLR